MHFALLAAQASARAWLCRYRWPAARDPDSSAARLRLHAQIKVRQRNLCARCPGTDQKAGSGNDVTSWMVESMVCEDRRAAASNGMQMKFMHHKVKGWRKPIWRGFWGERSLGSNRRNWDFGGKVEFV